MLSTRDERISRLHELYEAESLDVLVGAGPSIAVGLPDWDELCRRLVSEYCLLGVAPGDIDSRQRSARKAATLYGTLTRDVAADLVYRGTRDDAFPRLLSKALYGAFTREHVKPNATHMELAAMAAKAKGRVLHTLNYDPLLEMALAYLDPATRGDFRAHYEAYRRPTDPARPQSPSSELRVDHVHGWVEWLDDHQLPPGMPSHRGPLILTESHYQALAAEPNAPINRTLDQLLEGELLVVGLSLSDPNLKRLLYKRRPELRQGRVFVVLRCADEAAFKELDAYWSQLGVYVVPVREFEEIPNVLRQIRFGDAGPGEDPRWMQAASRWVAEATRDEVFTQVWQARTHNILRAMQTYLRVHFEMPSEEQIELSLCLPVMLPATDETPSRTVLCKVSSTRSQEDGFDAERHARERTFGVGRGVTQGVAGKVFTEGGTWGVVNNQAGIDANFTPEMKRLWVQGPSGYRDWKSVFSTAILDGPDWLPVAVVNVTSSARLPFWRRDAGLTSQEVAIMMLELKRTLRRAARRILFPERPALLRVGAETRGDS